MSKKIKSMEWYDRINRDLKNGKYHGTSGANLNQARTHVIENKKVSPRCTDDRYNNVYETGSDQ